MSEAGPGHLLRVVKGVRLLPKNPPAHAVTLAVITAAVLGAATGVVLAIAAPAPDSSAVPPVAMVTAALPSRPPDVVDPGMLAIRRPDPRPTTTTAEPAPEVQPSVEVPLEIPVVAVAAPAAAPGPAPPPRIPAVPGSAPRAMATRSPAARSPVPMLAAASTVSRSGVVPSEPPPLAAAGAPAVGLSPPDAPARPSEGVADDGSSAEELVSLTERAFQSGHPAEAVRLGKKALAAHAGARAYLALAAAYFDLRRFDDARSSYEAVLQAEPGNQAARIGLDLVKTAQARPPEPQP